MAVVLSASACEAGAKKPKADTAATLVAFTGKAMVKPAGAQPREAVFGDELKAEDAVAVPAGGFALLRLVGNGHVVRIDEELELEVRELALFAAPKTEVALKAQLDQLLTPAEKNINERMTGFYATAAAAETRGAEREKSQVTGLTRAEGVEKKTKTESVAPQVAAAAPAAPPPPPAPAPRPAAPEAKAPAESFGDESGGGKQLQQHRKREIETLNNKQPPPDKKPAAGESASDAQPVKETEAVAQKPAPAPWPGPDIEKGLRGCLAPSLAAPGVRQAIGDSLTLKYRLSGGTLRIALEGALPVPGCVSPWLRTAPVTDRWQSFELEL